MNDALTVRIFRRTFPPAPSYRPCCHRCPGSCRSDTPEVHLHGDLDDAGSRREGEGYLEHYIYPLAKFPATIYLLLLQSRA